MQAKPDAVSLRAFVAREFKGQPMSEVISVLAQRWGVAYGTLQRHLVGGLPVSARTAQVLQDASFGAVSGAKTLGLEDDGPAPGETA